MTLSEYLTANGLSDERFAQMVGVARTTVLRWRKGLTPDKPALLRIVDATGGEVTPNDFYGVESQPEHEGEAA